MCTNNKDQGSSMERQPLEMKNALCILHGIQSSLRVDILDSDDTIIEGQNKRRVRLNRDDTRHFMEEHKVEMSSNLEVVLPAKCLIPPVSYQVVLDKSQRLKLFGDFYYPIQLNGVEDEDLVAWAPPTPLDRTVLIPCTIFFTGRDTLKDVDFAYVFPPKHFSVIDVQYTSFILKKRVPGWGSVYKVPLSDIYRWENINERRRQLKAELRFEKMEPKYGSSGSYRIIYYEFVYSQVQDAQPAKDCLNNKVSSDVQENLDVSKEGTEKKFVTRVKLDERTTSMMHESFDKIDTVKNTNPFTKENDDGLDPLQKQMSSSENYDYPDAKKEASNNGNQDDAKQSSLNGNFSEPTSSHSQAHQNNEITINENSKPVFFGKCFTKEEKFEKAFPREFEFGDAIVASPKDRDDVLGKVGLICKIPSLKQNQIFVGVEFEDSINAEPFEVRHIWGPECGDSGCMEGKHVFIPAELLLGNGSPLGEHLRILKDTPTETKGNAKDTIPVSDIQVNFQYEATRRDFVHQPLDYDKLSNEKLAVMGIEGNANSCYVDAVIFALFAFTNRFDYGLLSAQKSSHQDGNMDVKIQAARNLLKYDIVTPLRCAEKVSWVHVFKMRKALAEILNDKSYLGNFMDTETFIVSLFSTVLQAPEFFEIGDDNKDFVLQLFPPMVNEGEEIKSPSLQYLLDEYCKWADIKLNEIPQAGFVIKLPVSDGIRQFKNVYPDLFLNMNNVLAKKDGPNDQNFMVLRSVICLKKSHFTCFVRIPRKEVGRPVWVYHDSMAVDNGKSIITECELLEEGLQLIAPIFHNPSQKVDETPLKEGTKTWIWTILSSAYICVYEPLYASTSL